jgi:hypothetical protein
VHTSQAKSALIGGSNKLRYGGRNFNADGSGGQDANLFQLSQISLVMDAPMPMGTLVHAQMNLNTDTDAGNGTVGIMEAWGQLDHRWGPYATRVRAGAFIPLISWEHPNNAWSTEYTLTPSAIGSWLEDAKVIGGEDTWEISGEGKRLRFTGAVFSGGDQTGSALTKRGWDMQDLQANLNSVVNIPGGATGQPIREIDGQLGYYGRAGFSLWDDLLQGSAGYWDNDGNVNGNKFTDPGESLGAWHTRFWDAGGKLEWHQFTLIGQIMDGHSFAATVPLTLWESWYGLASVRLGPWIFSSRYDRFLVSHDLEFGYGLTGDIQYVLNPRNRVILEYIEIHSRPNLVTGGSEIDQIAQLNYRFLFGK